MEMFRMDLQHFAEGGGAAGPAGGGDGGSEAAENNLPAAGETLGDGTKVDARLAAAMEDQVKRHPELKEKYARARGQSAQPKQAAPAENTGEQGNGQPGEKTADELWEEAKKGQFKEQYGKDVQKAIQERFKNHEDLSKYEPMLKVLRERAGVEDNDALMKTVLDDDSLWEKKAEEMGMTVEAAKTFTQMQQELEQRRSQEKADIEQRMLMDHIRKLSEQAEALKQRIPDFDLREALKDPVFKRMTAPDVGVSVEAAYFAIHHNEMMPQAIAYGIKRGVKQVSETIQATGRRPAEGAMQGTGAAAAHVTIDPRALTPQQRDEMVRQARLGKRISFD